MELRSFLFCFIVLCASASAQDGTGLVRHPLDKAVSRTLVLDNRLQVLLISDPGFNKSAASLDLAAGALSDPRDRQGLAHLTEHMLFINTGKYPEVNAFNRFLANNGGYRNGFTAGGNTNYHFEVHHDALEEALDRFAQFFIAPLFDSTYTDREMHAVDSEHKKNVMNDSRREYQLFRSLCRRNHPMNMFSTGDLTTLAGASTREMKEFYKKHSSANLMSLAVLSTKSLDGMERMVRASFTAVPDNGLDEKKFDPVFLDTVAALRLVRMVPVKDLRQLSLDFAFPDILPYYRSKPVRLLGACIGHEGAGSLLSYLKERGWATGLSAGGYPFCSSFASFNVTVSLTEKGLADYDGVLKAVFAYIRLLKENGIPQHVFDEAAAMARLDYRFADHGEGASRAVRLASDMNRYPLEDVQQVAYLYARRDTSAENMLLDRLRPDNMICMITAQGQETDTTEKYYGTEYSYTEDTVLYRALLDPPAVAALRLPAPNPYVPDAVVLLPERPVKLIDEKGALLWYLQDTEFKRPKVRMEFTFQVPATAVAMKHLVLLDYYTDCVNEQLNELAYPASEAGLYYGLSGGGRGVTVKVGGYSTSARQLLDSIVVQLKRVTVDETRFGAIKDRIVRQLENAAMNPAYQMARSAARKVRKGTYYLPHEMLPAARNVTLKDVKAFARGLYRQGHVWGLVHGNVTAPEAEAAFGAVRNALQAKPLAADAVFRQSILVQPEPETITVAESLATNNSSYWRFNLLGIDTPELRAAAKVINNFIEPPVFTELRTKSQLGYIVHGGATQDLDRLYLIFLLQSADYDAAELRARTAAFVPTLVDSFTALSAAGFAELKVSVAEALKEKPKNINERGARLASLAFDFYGDFGRREDELKALEGLSHARVAAILKETLAPETARITDILMFAAQHTAAMRGIEAVGDIDAFKKSRTYRRDKM